MTATTPRTIRPDELRAQAQAAYQEHEAIQAARRAEREAERRHIAEQRLREHVLRALLLDTSTLDCDWRTLAWFSDHTLQPVFWFDALALAMDNSGRLRAGLLDSDRSFLAWDPQTITSLADLGDMLAKFEREQSSEPAN